MPSSTSYNFVHSQNDQNILKSCNRWFWCLVLIQIFFWTILPAILLKNTYIDILENLMWGRHFEWGYDKDPFLGAFLTHLIYELSGKQIAAIYLLSQVSIVICYWSVWKLAQRILPPV